MPARSFPLRSIGATPRLVGLAFILAIGLIIVTGVSLVAAQPDDPVDPLDRAFYFACVNNSSGALRIAVSAQSCRNHETLITLGSRAGDAALLERIEALEATTTSQQTLIEAQQSEIEAQQGDIEALQQANTDQQEQIEALLTDVGALQSEITTLQGTVETLGQQHTTQQQEIDLLEEENGEHEQEIMTFEEELGDLSAAHTALQAQVPACLSTSGNEVYFTGCNVNIRSGSGSTYGEINGLGNLIVGYNEPFSTVIRTGSHNLVVGPYHGYSNYGGLVAGFNNTVSGSYSTVSGGVANTASGDYGTVSGGYANSASSSGSSVSGGYLNIASGEYSSISGGLFNTASGNYSSVSGGLFNTASGHSSSISGGELNIASGDFGSSVSGGFTNTASGDHSSVGGSIGQVADATYEFLP